MPANPDDISELVERALCECEEEYRRGVHSFHAGQTSDRKIRPGVIESVKNLLRPTFHERLKEDGEERWKRERDRVRRVGFYAGALAALHSYGSNSEWLEEDHARDAMVHVSKKCKDPENRERLWFYCPWWE